MVVIRWIVAFVRSASALYLHLSSHSSSNMYCIQGLILLHCVHYTCARMVIQIQAFYMFSWSRPTIELPKGQLLRTSSTNLMRLQFLSNVTWIITIIKFKIWIFIGNMHVIHCQAIPWKVLWTKLHSIISITKAFDAVNRNELESYVQIWLYILTNLLQWSDISTMAYKPVFRMMVRHSALPVSNSLSWH